MAGPTIYYRAKPGKSGPHFETRRPPSEARKAVDLDRGRRRWFLRYARAFEVLDNPFAWNIDYLAQAQDGRCGICGEPLVWVADKNGPMRTTIEHVIPQKRGGHLYGNIVKAHNHCNQRKGDRWPTGCEILFLAATNAHLLARAQKK